MWNTNRAPCVSASRELVSGPSRASARHPFCQRLRDRDDRSGSSSPRRRIERARIVFRPRIERIATIIGTGHSRTMKGSSGYSFDPHQPADPAASASQYQRTPSRMSARAVPGSCLVIFGGVGANPVPSAGSSLYMIVTVGFNRTTGSPIHAKGPCVRRQAARNRSDDRAALRLNQEEFP